MENPLPDKGRSPKVMSLSDMRNIFQPHLQQLRKDIFINDELAVLHGNANAFRLVMKHQPPFSINDHRLGIVASGEIDANINLVEKHIVAGTLIFLGPGTIISPLRISDDLEIYGFGLSDKFPMPFLPGQMPAAFNGQVRDFQLSASATDIATARQILETLWQAVRQADYNRPLVSSLVSAQMHHYDALFRRYTDWQQSTQSREQTIFDRFIYLVNLHTPREHHIPFYARKMCLTERYLGTVIRQTSGITAKEWIDRALITRIQVELRHTGKSVAQISDEMNFPNPSFFCKYVKRLMQVTPAEYRGKD